MRHLNQLRSKACVPGRWRFESTWVTTKRRCLGTWLWMCGLHLSSPGLSGREAVGPAVSSPEQSQLTVGISRKTSFPSCFLHGAASADGLLDPRLFRRGFSPPKAILRVSHSCSSGLGL